MILREIVLEKLKAENKLELWPKARVELFSLENQELCEKYLKLYESKKKYKNTINSLVAYILGICDDEPTGEMEIIGTPGLADIDTDFDSERRDEVVEFVKERFGAENVSSIAAYGQYKLKSSIQNILKDKMTSRGQDPAAATEISKSLPFIKEDEKLTATQQLDLATAASPEFAIYLRQYPEDRELIEGVLGAYQNTSVHPAGIVIGTEPIYKSVPMIATPKGEITAMDKDDIEEMGLVKFDLLSVANITKIAQCLDLIEKRHGVRVDLVKDIDMNDKKCMDRFAAGDVDTIFQYETSSFQDILTNQIPISNFDDIVVIVAIGRPGAKKFISDYYYERFRKKEADDKGPADPDDSPIGTYASNKKDPTKIRAPHPSLFSILQETHGIPIYQEQALRIVQTLSGASFTEADKLRKAIGKKKGDLFEKCRQNFIKGCKQNDISDDVISSVWALLQEFDSYSFNKAHSAAYATIGFWNMWLRTYYPAEWYAAVFAIELDRNKKKMLEPVLVKSKDYRGNYKRNYKTKLEWYIDGASSGGFDGTYKKCAVWSPNINKSHHRNAVIERIEGHDAIYLPFSVIEQLGANVSSLAENKKLLPNGKYETVKEIVEYSGLSESLLRKLVDNGAFEDDFGTDLEKINAEVTYYLRVKAEEKKVKTARQRKTKVPINNDIRQILFEGFEGEDSIQVLPPGGIADVGQKHGSTEVDIGNGWFEK
jgi:DNA polymerase III alpha subunit